MDLAVLIRNLKIFILRKSEKNGPNYYQILLKISLYMHADILLRLSIGAQRSISWILHIIFIQYQYFLFVYKTVVVDIMKSVCWHVFLVFHFKFEMLLQLRRVSEDEWRIWNMFFIFWCKNICFTYLLELPQRENLHNQPHHKKR